MNKLKVWFLEVSRGYSLPMSIFNWLIIFIYSVKLNGNIFYGILALLGVLSAHAGVNVFDDVIDTILKTPKQECKTSYLDKGIFTLRDIIIGSFVYFLIALGIGIFLACKCGIEVIIISAIAALICLCYPKLNNFALGELAVGLTFGPLLFLGVNFVMLQNIDIQAALLSLPVTILTVVVLMIHSLMDYDFDIQSGKKTLCLIMGTKNKALNLVFVFISASYLLTFYLVWIKALSPLALSIILTIPLAVKLYKSMNYYNNNEQSKNDFMKNFVLTRNLSLIYNVIIICSLILK